MSKTGKRVLSFILITALSFCICLNSACAVTAEFKTTQQFLDFLDAKGYKYSYVGVDEKAERVNVSFSLDNFTSVECAIFFKNDLEEVSLRVWNIITASAGKNYVLSTLNTLNKEYKFSKFVFDDSDSTVQAELDMYIDPDHCDRSVYDAMMILIKIIDNDEIAKTLHSLE